MTNISSAVHFTETRRYLKAAIKPLTDTMYIDGRLEITENGSYDNNMRMNSNDSGREVNGFYRMEVDGIAVEYEVYANGNINDSLPREDLNDRSKQIVKTWDPKTKPTIPVRMLSYNSDDGTFYDLYEDEAAMNANRKGYTVQIPNRITYTNNQAIVEKATRWFDEVARLGLNVDYVCKGKEGNNLKFFMYAYTEGDTLHTLSPGDVTIRTNDPKDREYQFNGNQNRSRYLFEDTDVLKPYQEDYTRYTNPTSRMMKLTRVDYTNITPIVRNIPIRRTRYFMDLGSLKTLAQAPLTGTVTINGTRQAKNSVYSGNIDFSNISQGHYFMEYTLNGNRSMNLTAERDPQRVPYSLTINNFDGSNISNIPARFTKFSNMPVGQYIQNNGSFNARPLEFTIRNELTVKDNVALVEEAKAIMERLKSKHVFIHQLLEDFDANERARFEQRVYVPQLRDSDDMNIQVRMVGESNTFRLPLTDKPFTMTNHPWVNKPNRLEDEYPLAKPNTIQLELVSVNGITVPGSPRYDIRVSETRQLVKHSALANRVENMDITGNLLLEGKQEQYASKLNGHIGKASYSKLPSGRYDIQFILGGQTITPYPIVNRSGNSTLGDFAHVTVPNTVTHASLPRTVTASITDYRRMPIYHDTEIKSSPVSIALDNKLTLNDQRAQPDVGDLYNHPTGNAEFDKIWDTADIRITIFRLEGNVDTRNRFGTSANMLHTYTRMPAGRYKMQVMADSVKTTNGKLVVPLPSVFGPGFNMFGRAWSRNYGIEKVGEFDYIGSPPMTDAWKTASINVPYKKTELVVNSKAKTYAPRDPKHSNPIDQFDLKFRVYSAVGSLLPLKDRHTLGIISSWLELDHISNAGKIDITVADKTFTIDPRSTREYQDKMFCPIYIWTEHQDLMVPRYNREVIPYRKNLGNGRFDTNMFQDIGYDKTIDVTKEAMIPRKIKAKITVTSTSNTVWKKDVLIPVQFHVINGLNKDFDSNSREDILPRKNRKVPQFISYE